MVEDFGPYRIVRKIAVGGMAEIYLARHRGLEGLERTVVLKRILPTYSHNPEFVTMFLDEARLMAALSHPNIAQVFDLGKVEESYYLVMEYVRGPTLGGLLSAAGRAGGGGLPEREALNITLNIAEALDYVHGLHDDLGRPLNIVHRDLNPANVLVGYTGAVKLIDFGIAKAATKVYETRTGVIKGTYGYIAPEQLTHAIHVDHRADVFALGVLMYEMCVGKHPFDTSDEPNLIDRILDAKYKRPRQVVPSFPRPLDRLISRCMAPHPEGRPESVRRVIEEMIAYMAQRALIPTMGDIAGLAHALVPDKEGATPLKPLRSSQVQHPPFRTGHSRTAPLPKIGQDGTDLVAEPPGLADLLEGEEATVEIGAGHLRVRTDADMHPPQHVHVEIHPHDEEAPTRVSSMRGATSDPLRDMPPLDPEPPTAMAVEMPRLRRSSKLEPTEMDMALRARAGSSSGLLRRTLLLIGSAVLVVGVGVAAFVTARAIGGSRRAIAGPVSAPPAIDASPADSSDAESDGRDDDAAFELAPDPIQIFVLSEPEGASIYVDGLDQDLQTPATVALPAETTSVWLRVAMEGYVSQEREVQSTVGEARFVLDQLEADAGPPEPPAAKRPRRRVQPRRRRPRRRTM